MEGSAVIGSGELMFKTIHLIGFAVLGYILFTLMKQQGAQSGPFVTQNTTNPNGSQNVVTDGTFSNLLATIGSVFDQSNKLLSQTSSKSM